MIALRCSNRATLDLSARIDLKCGHLWRELDSVQEQIIGALESSNMSDHRYLLERERQILRELEDWL